MEPREITARAGILLEKRLAEYQKPEIDGKLEENLVGYVMERKQALYISKWSPCASES